jgi:6-phosphofructokinase 2
MPTRKIRTHNQRQEAGGGGVNVARMIAELGGNPSLLVVSGGATGAMLEESLTRLPIKADVVHAREMTRIAFMVHEQETNLEYRFVPEGPIIATSEIEEIFVRLQRFRGDFVVASGSVPRGAPDDMYARMAKIAAANGARFVLDTSGEPLKHALDQGGIFLVKPSLGELEAVTGKRLTLQAVGEAALDLVRKGSVQYVAVTLGMDGALLAGADGVRILPAADVPVRSAVGAGDAFLGALVWSLAQGGTPLEAFRWGVAGGAAAVMTPGMELARKEDVVALHAQSLHPAGLSQNVGAVASAGNAVMIDNVSS